MFFGSGEKTYKQIKNLNKIPENQSFLVFLFLKKLGSLNSLFYLKRVTSCGSRNRTCVVELMRLSWCLLQSTPPYLINSERATDSQKGWPKSYYIVRFTLDLFSELLFDKVKYFFSLVKQFFNFFFVLPHPIITLNLIPTGWGDIQIFHKGKIIFQKHKIYLEKKVFDF